MIDTQEIQRIAQFEESEYAQFWNEKTRDKSVEYMKELQRCRIKYDIERLLSEAKDCAVRALL